MMKDMETEHPPLDENMPNLISASGDQASVSSTDNGVNQSQPSIKRKRNPPGNPDPDAQVVALSPKSLMATHKFVCEICKKGFQREQNLQLHRRGHNLPWKLKQKSSKEVRKKVYVCPESTCVHHDPSRALGDLTGIKKHFCRKHGEKKWKCEKCSKKYAVRSDWKAHSNICGTRDYRCDCGTLFSRRDSFITHRAFCDALAEESSRSISGNKAIHEAHQFQQIQASNQNEIPFPIKKEPFPSSFFRDFQQNPNPSTMGELINGFVSYGNKLSDDATAVVTCASPAGDIISNSQLSPLSSAHPSLMINDIMMDNHGFDGSSSLEFGMTRDFMGLSQSEILSIAGFTSCFNNHHH